MLEPTTIISPAKVYPGELTNSSWVAVMENDGELTLTYEVNGVEVKSWVMNEDAAFAIAHALVRLGARF